MLSRSRHLLASAAGWRGASKRWSSNLARIKELRERTGAPMHEVKSALLAAHWDTAAALEELQRRGQTAASKKATRVAAEGLVGVATSPHASGLVEVNSETDFVARNPKFQSLVSAVASAAAGLRLTSAATNGGAVDVPLDVMQAAPLESYASVSTAVAAVAAEVRENVKLRRAVWLPTIGGVVGSYVHGGTAAQPLGRMGGVLVVQPNGGALLDAAARAEVAQLANGMAMHVVANRPSFVSATHIPASVQEAQQGVFMAQAAASGKPAAIAAKMTSGWMQKWHEEVCLLEQRYLMDDTMAVKEAMAQVAARVGVQLSVSGFARLQAGEGIERAEKDFAAEVAEVSGVGARR